ncbi:MAG: signal peptidase I [Bdellovibrionota bacterium]
MNKFLAELKSIFIIVAVVFIFRSSILNWYVIPSGSLLPSLKIGDHVVVNKLSYGFMFPFMENRITSWAHPERGDIVVFKGPESDNGLTLIKRVVGIPGDKISFTNGVLTINGVLAKEELLHDRTAFENMGGNENGDGYDLFQESGFSHFPHYIMRRKWGGITESESQVWVVPSGKLLLIGDNRDNSADGRFWGFMDEDRIYGRAFLISYSTYDTPDSWLPKLRNDRWFKTISN